MKFFTLFANSIRAIEEVKQDVYVGIDLGTTFSCVSMYFPKTKQYSYLTFNGENPETFPSVVYVEPEKQNGTAKIHVGYDAMNKNKNSPNSHNYFFGFKRLMGIPYENSVVNDFRNSVTYSLKEYIPKQGAQGIVVFPAKHSDNTMTQYSPTDLSALILGNIYTKITAQFNILATVITTPAYFTVNQDQETRNAAIAAGFGKVEIFKEPTAACIEYAQEAKIQLDTEEKILVFDLGGGTFDISVVEVENDRDNKDKKLNSNITVSKYVGDNFLGGENINNEIFAHFKSQINGNLNANEAMRLRLFVEKIKIEACNKFKENRNNKVVEKFFDDNNNAYTFELDEPTFDKLAGKVYGRINELLFDSKIGLFRYETNKNSLDKPIKINEIEKIILVGGSTRVPYIKRYLKEKFTKATIFDGVDADKSVAAGACKMCVNTDPNSEENTVMLLNATTLPIGIAVHDGSFKAILEKDVVIPTEASEIFSTVEDNQRKITLQVATGVRPLFKQNHQIGTFELELKEPKPRGVPRIQVKVEMSADYQLKVIATDLDTNISNSKVFQENYVGTDKKLVQEILNNAKNTEAEDNETRAKLEQNRLLRHAIELYENQLKDAKDLTEDQKLRFETTIQTHKEWQTRNGETAKSEEIEAQIKLLEGDAKELADALAQSKTSGSGKQDKEAL